MPRYTPEERAERRRRSSSRSTLLSSRGGSRPPPLIGPSDGGGDDDASWNDDASWIADLRAQGVDVDEFLKVARPPPEVVVGPQGDGGESLDDSYSSERSRPGRPRRMARLSILSLNPDRADVAANGKDKRFTQFLDKAYVFDETVGDMVISSFEDMAQKRWQKEVREDSKNYSPDPAAREKAGQNRDWAVAMARRRVARDGGDGPAEPPRDAAAERGAASAPETYPRVDPPPASPLPPITVQDFDIVAEPTLNPGELGIAPPDLPHGLAAHVPRAARGDAEGIADGVATDRGGPHDAGTMVVECANPDCDLFLQCPRRASLVQCDDCGTVSPACPVAAAIKTLVAAGREGHSRSIASGSSSDAVKGSVASGSSLGTGGPQRISAEF